jgi:hypothetical protein
MWDTEMGNDLTVADRLDVIDTTRVTPLNRSEIGAHPSTGRPILMCRYPAAAGFVPRGAVRADGVPHPHAGTGFAMSHIIGYPVDATGCPLPHEAWRGEDPYAAVELQQYRYDGCAFLVEHSARLPFSALLDGWEFTSMPLGNCLADGDDLLGGLVGKPNGSDEARSSGMARWQRTNGRWRLVSFVPVKGSEGSYEPSLVRDTDDSLLVAVRGGQPGPDENSIMLWRSTDGGVHWDNLIHAKGVRAGTPVSINKGPGGVLYIAGNPHREADSLGRRLSSQPSIAMREMLLAWPLSDDRRRLLEPVIARDCVADFGPAPSGSIWWADHPVGQNVRLADSQWHHLLTYRLLEQNECVGGAPATPHTGAYLQEVLGPGPSLPEWVFGAETSSGGSEESVGNTAPRRNTGWGQLAGLVGAFLCLGATVGLAQTVTAPDSLTNQSAAVGRVLEMESRAEFREAIAAASALLEESQDAATQEAVSAMVPRLKNEKRIAFLVRQAAYYPEAAARFEKTIPLRGWGNPHHVDGFQETAEGLAVGTITNNDPHFMTADNLNIDMGSNRTIKVTFRNGSAGRLASFFFATSEEPVFAEDKKLSFAIKPNDSGFSAYATDAAGHAKWKGKLKQLRFDLPNDGVTNGSFAVKEVILSDFPAPRE